MTICYEPNKGKAPRFRVFDKMLGKERIFYVKKLGLSEATKQAGEYQANLDLEHALIAENNRIFIENGIGDKTPADFGEWFLALINTKGRVRGLEVECRTDGDNEPEFYFVYKRTVGDIAVTREQRMWDGHHSPEEAFDLLVPQILYLNNLAGHERSEGTLMHCKKKHMYDAQGLLRKTQTAPPNE